MTRGTCGTDLKPRVVRHALEPEFLLTQIRNGIGEFLCSFSVLAVEEYIVLLQKSVSNVVDQLRGSVGVISPTGIFPHEWVSRPVSSSS